MTIKKRSPQKTLEKAMAAAKGLQKTLEPALAYSYRAACINICRVQHINISKKDHPKILDRQRMLDAKGIAYDTYAYTVVKTYWQWAKEKGMKVIPISMFCGDAAWERFCELEDSTVRLETASDEHWNLAVHSELMAAKMYIGGKLDFRFALTLDLAREFAHSVDPSRSVIAEVERLVGMMYGVEGSYNEIARELKERRYERHAAMPVYVKKESSDG